MCMLDVHSGLKRAVARLCVSQQALQTDCLVLGVMADHENYFSSITVTQLDYISQTTLSGVVMGLSSSK